MTDTTTDCNLTYPRNILFVFDEITQSYKGAQVEMWRRVILNGEVLRNDQMPAQPITDDALPGVLSSINTAATAQVEALTTQLATANQQVSDLSGQVTTLTGQISDTQQQMSTQHDSMQATIDGLAKQVADLQAQITALTTPSTPPPV